MSYLYDKYFSWKGKKEAIPATVNDGHILNVSEISSGEKPCLVTEGAISSTDTSPSPSDFSLNSPTVFQLQSDIKLQSVPKTDDAYTFLKETLNKYYMFTSFADEDMHKVIEYMHPLMANEGDVLMRKGDFGEALFCIQSGSMNIVVDNEIIKEFSAGDCFGELTQSYNGANSAYMTVTSNSLLWALDLKVYRHITSLSAAHKTLSLCSFLRSCSYLDTLSNDNILQYIAVIEEITYDNQKVIDFQQLQNPLNSQETPSQISVKGAGFCIVQTGKVRCRQTRSNGREFDLITFYPGDCFSVTISDIEHSIGIHNTSGDSRVVEGQVSRVFISDSSNTVILYTPDNIYYTTLWNASEQIQERIRVQVLRSLQLLGSLREDQMTSLCSVMTLKSYVAGELLLSLGQIDDRLYLLESGEVSVGILLNNEGSDQVEEGSVTDATIVLNGNTAMSMRPDHISELVRLSPLEFFGERSLIEEHPSETCVRAVTPVQCWILKRDDFFEVLLEMDAKHTREMEEKKALERQIEQKKAEMITYNLDDLEFQQIIGVGNFGRVRVVRHKQSGKLFAAKCMNKLNIVLANQQSTIIREKNLLRECIVCPFIIDFVQTFAGKDTIDLMMELAPGGELWSCIYERGNLIPRNAAGGFQLGPVIFYAANIIIALEFLRSKKIAYRDIKPENLLLDSRGYLKLVDFGFAKVIPFTNDQGVLCHKTYTMCGTPDYVAPEVVLQTGYDSAVDIWALGCLIFEMYTLRTPFQHENTAQVFHNMISWTMKRTPLFPLRNRSKSTSRGVSGRFLIDSTASPMSQASQGSTSSRMSVGSGTSLVEMDFDKAELEVIVSKLMDNNPVLRLGCHHKRGLDDIKQHSFFEEVIWDELIQRNMTPPYVPVIDGNGIGNFESYEDNYEIPSFDGEDDLLKDF